MARASGSWTLRITPHNTVSFPTLIWKEKRYAGDILRECALPGTTCARLLSPSGKGGSARISTFTLPDGLSLSRGLRGPRWTRRVRQRIYIKPIIFEYLYTISLNIMHTRI